MPLHGVGGLERSVHDLVRHLAARGVEVTLDRAAGRSGAAADARRPLRLTTHPYPARPIPVVPIRQSSWNDGAGSQHVVPAVRMARRPPGAKPGEQRRRRSGARIRRERARGIRRNDGAARAESTGARRVRRDRIAAHAEACRLRAAAMGRPPRGLTSVVHHRDGRLTRADGRATPHAGSGSDAHHPERHRSRRGRSAGRPSRRAADETTPPDRHRRARVRQRRPARIQQGVRPAARRARAGERTRQHARGDGLAVGGRRKWAVPRRDRTRGRSPSASNRT